MIRNLFRFFAIILLSGAVIAAVLDAAKFVATSKLVFTPLQDFLSATGIIDVTALKNEISLQYGADLWSVIESGLLHSPIWFVFGILAFLLYIISYRSLRPFEILSH